MFCEYICKHSKIYFKKSIKVRICCCLMSFELSAFANYINLQKCLSLSLSVCVCVLCLPNHMVMNLFSVHFICQNLKMPWTPISHTCVCVCVSE